jgi:hypothetical protein
LADGRANITAIGRAELELLGLLEDFLRENELLFVTERHVGNGVVD